MLRFPPKAVSTIQENPFIHVGPYSYRQKKFKPFSDFEVQSQADMGATDAAATDLPQTASQSLDPGTSSLIPPTPLSSPRTLHEIPSLIPITPLFNPRTPDPKTPPRHHGHVPELLGKPHRTHKQLRHPAIQTKSSLLKTPVKSLPALSLQQVTSPPYYQYDVEGPASTSSLVEGVPHLNLNDIRNQRRASKHARRSSMGSPTHPSKRVKLERTPNSKKPYAEGSNDGISGSKAGGKLSLIGALKYLISSHTPHRLWLC